MGKIMLLEGKKIIVCATRAQIPSRDNKQCAGLLRYNSRRRTNLPTLLKQYRVQLCMQKEVVILCFGSSVTLGVWPRLTRL